MAKPAATATKPKSSARGPSPIVRGYLIAFNLICFFLWALVLSITVKHLLLGPQTPTLPTRFAERTLAKLRPLRVYFAPIYGRNLPAPLRTLLERASSLQSSVGGLLAFTQSLAVLEIAHAATGLVRSPVPTTAIQVFSRMLLVWGVSERFDSAASNPWFTSMVLAWSITECVRYPFYANGLMGSEGSGLVWARYTFFYVLYPLGAASEAQLMFGTLPQKWFWEAPSTWSLTNYVFLGLWCLWWPGLYIMYTHMIRQRRRALGSGFWGSKLEQETINKKQVAQGKKSK